MSDEKELSDVVKPKKSQSKLERITEFHATRLIQRALDELSDEISELCAKQQELLRYYRDLERAKEEYKLLYFYDRESGNVTYKQTKKRRVGF